MNRMVGLALLVLSLGMAPQVRAQGRFGATDEAPTAGGARRAIVIGVDGYDDPSFADLRYARLDAEGLADVLADPGYGGFASVELVVDGDLSAQGLTGRLQDWSRTLAPEDLGLIYFSGHGTRFVDERGRSHVFLAASDTLRADPLATGVPMQALQELLEALPASRRVLVLDACFTGDGKVGDGDVAAAARALVDEKLPFSERVQQGQAQLFATSWGRPALESESLGHGVYTAFLIEALGERFDEADLNGDLVVSVSEAHDLARDKTLETTGELQIPMVFYEIVGREQLILSGDPGSRRRVEMALVSAYEGPQQGLRMFVDGQEKGAFPRTVLVEPGSRRVEFRNATDKVVDTGRIRFSKEGVYSVRALRDGLNGGRHLLAAGYAHTWLPGEAWRSEHVPASPGFRLGYTFRFPSRVPLLRRLGIVVDASLGFFGEQQAEEGLTSPFTTLLDVGFGPVIRLDLPYVMLSVQPRFAVVNLLRRDHADPFPNWLFGAVGVDMAIGFRPINRLSFQVRYAPMIFNIDLQATGAPKPELMHRLVGTVEIGL
jgi:hypothetical protein